MQAIREQLEVLGNAGASVSVAAEQQAAGGCHIASDRGNAAGTAAGVVSSSAQDPGTSRLSDGRVVTGVSALVVCLLY